MDTLACVSALSCCCCCSLAEYADMNRGQLLSKIRELEEVSNVSTILCFFTSCFVLCLVFEKINCISQLYS